jgi:putative toxin-antitoxin system antitoxin component (TIGR02293 family)
MGQLSTTALTRYVAELIGASPGSDYELAALVENGLPLSTVNKLVDRGLTRREVFSLVIPERTLKHRKSRREKLSSAESDRVLRAARIISSAEAVLGERNMALQWLRQPKRRFRSRSPMEMMTTEAGARLVEEMLVQIDEGMFA